MLRSELQTHCTTEFLFYQGENKVTVLMGHDLAFGPSVARQNRLLTLRFQKVAYFREQCFRRSWWRGRQQRLFPEPVHQLDDHEDTKSHDYEIQNGAQEGPIRNYGGSSGLRLRESYVFG